MSTLAKSTQIKRFMLPTTADKAPDQQDWVEMDVSKLVAGDVLEVDRDTGEVKATFLTLAGRIKDWSYTDPAGAKLPVTQEWVRELDIADFMFLADQLPKEVKGMTPEEKKT